MWLKQATFGKVTKMKVEHRCKGKTTLCSCIERHISSTQSIFKIEGDMSRICFLVFDCFLLDKVQGGKPKHFDFQYASLSLVFNSLWVSHGDMLRLPWGFSRHHLINHLIMSSARETNMRSQDADGLMAEEWLKGTFYVLIHIFDISYTYINVLDI